VFERLADSSEVITEQAFCSACERLQVNLSLVECRRVFAEALEFTGAPEGRLDIIHFTAVVRESTLFHSLFSNFEAREPFKFDLSEFDWNLATYEAYKHPEFQSNASQEKYSRRAHGPLNDCFAEIRKTLDYSYHTNYNVVRQAWQDQLVQAVALRHAPVVRPWVVFTCGAMGAGKGYVLNWLSQNGIFPLEHVVKIDPDHFKVCMPEWKGFSFSPPLSVYL